MKQALGIHHRVRSQNNTLEVRQVSDPLKAIRTIKHTDGHQTICEFFNLVTPLTYDRLGDHDERLGEWVAAHRRHQLSRLADTHLVAQETTTNTRVILAFQKPLDTSGLERGKESKRHVVFE
jgi:hypothetical protein